MLWTVGHGAELVLRYDRIIRTTYDHRIYTRCFIFSDCCYRFCQYQQSPSGNLWKLRLDSCHRTLVPIPVDERCLVWHAYYPCKHHSCISYRYTGRVVGSAYQVSCRGMLLSCTAADDSRCLCLSHGQGIVALSFSTRRGGVQPLSLLVDVKRTHLHVYHSGHGRRSHHTHVSVQKDFFPSHSISFIH